MFSQRIKFFKEFTLKTLNDEEVRLSVPKELDQSLVKNLVFAEYSVIPMAVGRELAESEITTLKFKGDVIGFLIPGQALLSAENPMNTNRLFSAYSLVACRDICLRTYEADFSLVNDSINSTSSKNNVFIPNIFYAVIWNKKLSYPKTEFFPRHFVAFAKQGIYPWSKGKFARKTNRLQETYNKNITITANRALPSHVSTLILNLAPYTDDAFLRFFYQYQIIEMLMSEFADDSLIEVRQRFYLENDLSNTKLRDYINEFTDITKETPKIRKTLNESCAATERIAERILDRLKERYEDLNLADKIYRIRNIMFHDFRRIHLLGDDVTELEESLATYLLEKKLT